MLRIESSRCRVRLSFFSRPLPIYRSASESFTALLLPCPCAFLMEFCWFESGFAWTWQSKLHYPMFIVGFDLVRVLIYHCTELIKLPQLGVSSIQERSEEH